MRPPRPLLFAALVLSAALLPRLASAETRALIDGQSVGGWHAEEATLTPSKVEGESVLLFTVPVDWHGGEANYPIGWPRISLSVPPDQGDWRGWEQLHLRVLARSSAGRLPFRPLGVTVTSGGARTSWEKELQTLPVGQWQEATFDLRDLPDPSKVTGVGMFISEDKYADRERLDFAIAKLELVRYGQPTLLALRPVANVAFADARSLPVRVECAGLRGARTTVVALSLLKEGKPVITRRAAAGEGETQLTIPLPAGLSPGEYAVSGEVGGHALSAPVVLVASPWQEGKR